MNNKLIYIGYISKSKGFKGDILIKDVPFALETIKLNSKLFIGFSASFGNDFTLERIKRIDNFLVIKLKEIDDEIEFKKIKENAVYCNIDDIKKKNNSFFPNELIDLVVYDENDLLLGKIIDVWEMPANDVWVIDTKNGYLNLPATKNVIKNVNHNTNKVIVELPVGYELLIENKK